MKKFEYKIIERVDTISIVNNKFNFEEIETMLTGFGLESWELTSVLQDNTANGRKYLTLFLKREIENTTL